MADYIVGLAIVKHFGREKADAAVMVFDVVPGKEDLAESVRVLDRAETLWGTRAGT